MSNAAARGALIGFLLSALLWIGATQRIPLKREAETGVEFVDHRVDPTVILGFHDRSEPVVYLIEVKLISFGDEYETKCKVKRVSTDELTWEAWKRASD